MSRTQWSVFEELVHQLDPVLRAMTAHGVRIDRVRRDQLLERVRAEKEELIQACQTLVPPEIRPTRLWKKRPEDREVEEVRAPGQIKVCSVCGVEVESKAAHLKGGKKKNPCAAVGAEVRKQPGQQRVWLERLPFNPLSRDQLLDYLARFKHLPGKHIKTGRETVDDRTLQQLVKKHGERHPLYARVLKIRALQKVEGTFLAALEGDWATGHFSHAPETGRLCIAKGTPIEVLRDVTRFPAGVPIEEVQPGDWAYTFDDHRRLTLRRVVKAWPTGKRAVVRVHWKTENGAYGYTDMTPDHRVRKRDGSYVPAAELVMGDRVLALRRGVGAYGYARLWATGHREIAREHRFAWQQITGEVLGRHDHVHHKDGNKLNNRFENLERLGASQHLQQHAIAFWTPEERARQREVFACYYAQHPRKTVRGPAKPNWREAPAREDLEDALQGCGGSLVRLAEHYAVSYRTLQRWLRERAPRVAEIKRSYNRKGQRIEGAGREALDSTGGNKDRAARLLGIGFRRWQRDEALLHNHIIIAVEPLGRKVEVFDLEIEDTHNFIAGELCVHNSMASANWQQFSHRDSALYADEIRRCVLPRPGHIFVEADSSAIEAVLTGYFARDPSYMALATRGVHAFMTCKELGLEFTDANIKVAKRHPHYALWKRTVHLCCHPDHEVLTPAGWVRFATYDGTTPIAVWSPKGTITWEVPQAVHTFDFEGELVRLDGVALSACVTENHAWPFYGGSKSPLVQRRETSEILGKQGRIPVVGVWHGGDTPAFSDVSVQLAAAIQADAQIIASGVIFRLKRERKITRLLHLLEGRTFTQRCYDGVTVIYLPHAELIDALCLLTSEKTFDLPRVLALPLQQRLLLLREVLEWDGYQVGGPTKRRAYFSMQRANAEAIQTLAHLSGKQALLRRHVASGMWVVSFNARTAARAERLRHQRVRHAGQVHCVTVSTGYFLTRFNDRVSVTGNSNFGGGPRMLQAAAPEVFTTLRKAEEAQAAYLAEFPRIPEWWAEVRAFAHKHGYLQNPFGWRCYFWNVYRRRPDGLHELGEDGRACIAFLPQSSAAMFMRQNLKQMARDGWLDFMPCIGSVHDSVCLDVPEGRQEEAVAYLAQLLTRPIPELGGLQIGCEIKAGPSWGDLETVKVCKIAPPGALAA